jgi:hypothetical protein
MKRILGLTLTVLLLGTGCGELCFSDDCVDVCFDGDCGGSPSCSIYGDNTNGDCYCEDGDCEPYQQYPWCESDWDCFEDEQCVQGECQWDEPSWCDTDEECAEGQICSLTYECRDRVLGCPLTDECLADPVGYVPDWVGIDPLYMGEATGSGITARMEFLVDFYDDHFYGEAVVETVVPDLGQVWLNLIVTGDRSGSQLDGMIIDRDASERWFDATFEAQLVTASEIIGTVQAASDDGTFTLDLHLWRISPCGCETTPCTADTNCPEDHTCQNGTCTQGCTEECCSNTDCPEGQECQNSQCADPCALGECCLASDCPADDDCVNGACKTPCSDPCACDLGEACVGGYCQAAE